MVLYMIGLGLGDEDDITVKGLRLVQQADIVVLEAYTSVLGNVEELTKSGTASIPKTQSLYGRDDVIVADRDMVEQQAESLILEPAVTQKVCFLVVGDPVCATTHTDLWLRAQQRGDVQVEIVHNASIMGAAGASGLQLYTFGQTISLPWYTDEWKPTSFYDKILYNRQGGLHTLCLLDIQVKEPDFAALMKSGSSSSSTIPYKPPRFMSIAIAAEQLVYAEEQHGKNAYNVDTTICVGLARMGQATQCIKSGTLRELMEYDFGGPLHSLIICGTLHDLEAQVLKVYKLDNASFDTQAHEQSTEEISHVLTKQQS